MQNIEELLQQILLVDSDTRVVKSEGSSSGSKQQQGSLPKFVKIPISLNLLDNLNDLKSLQPNHPHHSPVLGSSSSSSGSSNTSNNPPSTSTSSSSSDEYENKVTTIKDILKKLVDKYINVKNNNSSNQLNNLILNIINKEKGSETDDDDDTSIESAIFGLDLNRSNININNQKKENVNKDKQYIGKQVQINWVSLLLKIHQVLLSSSLYQQLLKKMASGNLNESSNTLLNLVRDSQSPSKLNSKQVSLSSNSLSQNPDLKSSGGSNSNISSSNDKSSSISGGVSVNGAGVASNAIKSTPVTPSTGSPLLTNQPNNNNNDQSNINSEGSNSNNLVGNTIKPTPFELGSVAKKSNGTGSGSGANGSSSSSSFSLSSLMAGAKKDSVPQGLRELQERSSRVDQVRMMGKGESYGNPPSPSLNPNMNKLPSQYETDPVMLPDGTAYQNISQAASPSMNVNTNYNNSLNSNTGFISSGIPPTFLSSPPPHTQQLEIPPPVIVGSFGSSNATNATASIISPPPVNIMSSPPSQQAMGIPIPNQQQQQQSLRVSSSPFSDIIPQSTGMPPTRLTESYFPAGSSRGPPAAYEGGMNMISSSPNVGILHQTMLRSSGNALSIPGSQSTNPSSMPIGIANASPNTMQPLMMASTPPPQIITSNLATTPTSIVPQSSSSSLPITSQPQQIPISLNMSQEMPTIDNTIVPASSSFKAVYNNQNNQGNQNSGIGIGGVNTNHGVSIVQPITNISTMADQTLPVWLDLFIVVSSGDVKALEQQCDGLVIDLTSIVFVERASGRLDHLLESKLVELLNKKIAAVSESKTVPWIDNIYNNWLKSINIPFHQEVAGKLSTIQSEYGARIWNQSKYKKYLNEIVELRRKYPPTSSSSSHQQHQHGQQQSGVSAHHQHQQQVPVKPHQSSQLVSREEEEEVTRIVKSIIEDASYLISIQDNESIKFIERLAIGLMGHAVGDIRQQAVCLLNLIYDSHDWQLETPLKPVIRVIGDAFRVEFELNLPLTEDLAKRTYLLTVVPPTLRTSDLDPDSTPATLYVRNKVKVDSASGGTKLYYEAPISFYRAGYYDWRLVELSPTTGTFVPFNYFNLKLSTGSGGSAVINSGSNPTTPLSSSAVPASSLQSLIQGRFIVHPKLREEIMHEVWVDLQDAQWDPYRGEMTKKGNIQSLIDALDGYHLDGVTTLYVSGLLERSQHSHPFCPTDRELPNRSIGGAVGFSSLVQKAKQLGIKLVVDSTTRLSSRASHRKYNTSLCYTLDGKGQLNRLEGTDSAEFTWPDCVMMNMRKMSTWDMFVHEAMTWGARGVDGIRIDGAHTCPLLFRSNLDELYRLDSDDVAHYSNQQIFDGEIVNQPTEEGKNFGYWGTTPPSPKQSTLFHPNPLFIKLTRSVWMKYPQFVFLAEVYWERELHAIVSGLVPYSSAIPRALASVFDKGISKDGIVFDLRQRQTVRALYDYYEMRMTTYPQNSIILFPSSTHHSPYPLQIYNAGAWAAVDMLYFLPEIPITYIGEQQGWYYHVDTHTSRVKVGMSATPYQLQYPQIRGHYAHRVSLRKNHTLLRRGGMIPLLCYHANGWHDRVFGFARFSGDEVAIIAINFNNHDTDFYIDCSPLAKISTEESAIYRLVDLINPSNPPQFLSLQELLYEKHFVSVPGFSSICWGVYHQVKSPAAVRVLYEHSMTRLKQLLSDNVDPSNNLIYSLLKKGLISGVDEFGKALGDILSNLSGDSEKTFAQFIQVVLYHLTRSFDGLKIISFLEQLSTKKLNPNQLISSSINNINLGNINGGTNNQLTEQQLNLLNNMPSRLSKICKDVLQCNTLGPIVFITPEIGRFSTVGGVGVMLDELTRSLQLLGVEVHIISPYYNYGKGGRTGYLEKEEGIKWQRNVVTYVGPDKIEVGVHSGDDKGINLHFLHHFEYFPTPYNSGSPVHQLKTIVLFAKASLELLCQIRVLPSVIVTNDWFCGLVPGYARAGAFGATFNGTTFFHLVHNLEEAYQGRIYPEGGDDLNWIHQLHRDLIMDPYSQNLCLNASRCALLTCNNWGTVSKSYLYDLLRTSHLSNLLHRFPQAFAHSNGIRVNERRLQLTKLAPNGHKQAKELLQKKYFNGVVDDSIPILSFVGRIVLQKGVHLILNAMRELIQHYQGKIQVLVGGMANMKDPYASSCAWSMQALCKQYPNSFWADPDAFFSDGSLVNLGSDFGLMPSLFEPSGVVQQEYFAAGTPVIAFKTGGLKDTVFEYNTNDETGNGFTFEAHKHTDFVQAVHRAISIYQNDHHYQQIRARSYESVLDMQVVAEAWAKEFSRLRKSIWAPHTSTAVVPSSSSTQPPQQQSSTTTTSQQK